MATYQMHDGYATNMADIDFSVLFHGTVWAATKKMYVLSFGDGYVDFRGHDFKYNRTGTPVGGAVEGYAVYDVSGYQALSFGGYDVVVKTFVRAASSISKNDDQKLLAEMLSKNDKVIGADLADGLLGYKGNDMLYGGGGADYLMGGPGRDRYTYLAISESTEAARDTILGFADGDRVSLAAITDFHFIGTAAFSGTQAEVAYTVSGGDTIINADADGDGATDLSIVIDGTFTLTEADFIL